MPGRKGVANNPAGRPKGTPDRRTLHKTVHEQLVIAGFNPVQAMIRIAMDESIDIKTRKSATKDLLDKAYPDLKAVDIKSDQAISDMKEMKEYMNTLLIDNKKDY